MSFPAEARVALKDQRLRENLSRATSTIRAKREKAIGELEDWPELRATAAAAKDHALLSLDEQLVRLETAVTAAGGNVHWAPDAETANRIVAGLATDHGAREVAKVKSIATDEIGLNDALARNGIEAVETDLAELIVQLAGDQPSHILVPAIHKNRSEIRDLFAERLGIDDLTDDPEDLAEAARRHLRELFLRVRFGISGANFAIAETGSVGVVESEGNGRMCTTMPEVLVTVMGIEKVLASWSDLGVFLQLLPRSATGERMNPYTSIWGGVRENDGPSEFHLVLLDAGRSSTLADPIGRQALRCIRCSACLNVCPVYSRVGGHAYESVYPGPIGAILTPQLKEMEGGTDLPGASSLCGACQDVCPVGIEIPDLLVHLRGKSVERHPETHRAERFAMKLAASTFGSRRRYETAQKAARLANPLTARPGLCQKLPGPLAAWTEGRDLPPVPANSFRDWWRESGRSQTDSGTGYRSRTQSARQPETTSGPTRRTPNPRKDETDQPDDRSRMLGRIRNSLGTPTQPEPIPDDYRHQSGLGMSERVELFATRVADYNANVHVVGPTELADRLTAVAVTHGARRLAIPPTIDAGWIPTTVEPVPDIDLSPGELDNVDGCLTGCALGIAETGTIVLDGQEICGRRALTLVPDLHICVIDQHQIVGSVPEAIDELNPRARQGWPLTMISGPSATSDIELDRVEGVHGPRRLEVLIIRRD